MEAVQSGPYVIRIGLYADPDLSPTNLGEAFDYYSAVPGWGWRAIVYQARGKWRASSVSFGVALEDIDIAPPEPENSDELVSPAGRLVTLKDGGYAFEGGIALPPELAPNLGGEFALWVRVGDGAELHGAELTCRLRENTAWDALEPEALRLLDSSPARPRRQVWLPAETPVSHSPSSGGYREPNRGDLPGELTTAAERALALAIEEARRLHREEVGSEHLLLGLVSEGTSQAARALAQVGVDRRAGRAAEQFLNPAQPTDLETTPQLGQVAKKALLLAGDEARRLGESKVDTLPLLLALLRQGGRAVDLLLWLGVPLGRIYHLLGLSIPSR